MSGLPYTDAILKLTTEIPHLRRLPDADVTVTEVSPLCGSRIILDLKLAEGRVADFGLTVNACALGQAATALVGKQAGGLDLAAFQKGREALEALLAGNDLPPAMPWNELVALIPARRERGRHGAMRLPFLAFERALKQAL
jgi:NifU-like protein involved in Fe-S cluster formation